MSIASVTYNTSGSAGPYTITFPYLSETDIEVYLDDVLTANYTFASATTILLDTAPSAVVIEIRRNTQDDPYVDFADPSSLRESDLDTATLQSIYIAQEAKDAIDAVAADVADVAADLASAVVVAGNVPSPANPGDNNKYLKASAGTWSWQPSSATAAQISDSTAVGRSILTAADAAAVRTAAGAAKQLTPQVLSPSNSITIDASLGDYFTLVANTSFTLNAPTNPTHGQRIMLRVKQDGTGGRVATYNAAFRFGSDILAAVLSTSANKVDYLGFVYDSTDAKWDVVAFVKGY
jgi:hypothetical protein